MGRRWQKAQCSESDEEHEAEKWEEPEEVLRDDLLKRRIRWRKNAHSGFILTFHSGPGLPVSFQMNGNCPAGFNHVLNWQKNRGGKCFCGN